MFKKTLLLSSLIALSGCLQNSPSMLKTVTNTKLNTNQPVIEQINSQHKKSIFAVGLEADRKRNQSSGLGLIKHDELENYLNEQLKKLKKDSGFTSVPGNVYLFADTVFGARTSADGNIYIPYAVIMDLSSSDEVAALLAHELAHTIRGHFSSDIFVKAQKKGLAATAVVANFRKNEAGVIRSNDKKNIHKVMASLVISDGFINPGWTRIQELEADKLGLDIMIKAGYNPDGMFVLLEKMAIWDDKNKLIQQQQNASLEAKLGAIKVTNDTSVIGTTINSYLSQGASKFGAMIDRLNKSHDSADTRHNHLLEYSDKHYGHLTASTLETKRWSQIAKSSQTKQIWNALENSIAAQQAMSDKNYSKANQLLKNTRSNTNNQNFLHQTLYELDSLQNKNQSLQTHVNNGLRGHYPSLRLHIEKAKINSGNAEKTPTSVAQSLISTFDNYGRPADYYGDILALLSKSDMKPQVLALTAECIAKYAGEGINCDTGNLEESAKNNDFSYENLFKSLL